MTLRPTLIAVLSALALVAAGCGSDDGGEATTEGAAPAMPAATAKDFPPAAGKTLAELQAGLPEGPVLAPSVSILEPGTNRVGFALFDRARKQLSGAEVALYTSKSDGSALRGPFLARSESLEVEPEFRSRQTAEDPDAARGVYVADVPYKSRGDMLVTAVVRLDGRLVAASAFEARVGPKGATPPRVGDPATRVSTETVADAAGDLAAIDTRLPPARELHEQDFADVLGKRPAVLVFATPQLCQSKVCGPVVDIALQVKNRLGADSDVAFVHQEIFRGNDIAKGFRKPVAQYKLPTEPWTFVVDAKGIVRERFEGAFSVQELERAIQSMQ